MFKKIVAASAMLFAVASWAAVDANKATEAELDGLKGVGPALSKRIIEARNQSEFKDWADFMTRVKGVKDKSAMKLSNDGLIINGKPFTESAPAATVKKHDAKKDEPQASAAKAATKQ